MKIIYPNVNLYIYQTVHVGRLGWPHAKMAAFTDKATEKLCCLWELEEEKSLTKSLKTLGSSRNNFCSSSFVFSSSLNPKSCPYASFYPFSLFNKFHCGSQKINSCYSTDFDLQFFAMFRKNKNTWELRKWCLLSCKACLNVWTLET